MNIQKKVVIELGEQEVEMLQICLYDFIENSSLADSEDDLHDDALLEFINKLIVDIYL